MELPKEIPKWCIVPQEMEKGKYELPLNFEYYLNYKNDRLRRPIRMGIPKGSLNGNPLDDRDNNRGCTNYLFNLAGYPLEGYNPWNESPMPICKKLEGFIEFYTMKPKQFPFLLQRGILDMAILGKDTWEEFYSPLWSEMSTLDEGYKNFDFFDSESRLVHDDVVNGLEYVLQDELNLPSNLPENIRDNFLKKYGSRIEKWNCLKSLIDLAERPGGSGPHNFMDLGYGRVNVHFGMNLNNLSGKKRICFISSSYPNVTYRALSKYISSDNLCLAYSLDSDESAKITDSRINRKDNKGHRAIHILPMTSNTETMIKLGLGDIIVDAVSSGDSFRKNNLSIVGKPLIKNSTARLYLNDNFRSKFYNSINTIFPQSNVLKIFQDFLDSLKKASIEYGKTRSDSVYFEGGRNNV